MFETFKWHCSEMDCKKQSRFLLKGLHGVMEKLKLIHKIPGSLNTVMLRIHKIPGRVGRKTLRN